MRIGSGVIDTKRSAIKVKEAEEKKKPESEREAKKREAELIAYEEHFRRVYGGELRSASNDVLMKEFTVPLAYFDNPLAGRRARAYYHAVRDEVSRRQQIGLDHGSLNAPVATG